MSKPGTGTARRPSGKNTPGPNGAPKFYDGPTVAAKATEVKTKTRAMAKDVALDAKKAARRAKLVARRHPWSIISILSTIPFLLSISLLSTVLCPPPTQNPSFLSRTFLTPLGLSKQPSSLQETLCYPANVYHREILKPYVYPVLDDLQHRATSHPLYTTRIQPATKTIQRTAERVWERPLKPVVNRVSRGARKTYLTYVEPHIPGLKARFYTLTAPYTSRILALYNAYVRPHLETAYKYGQSAGDSSVRTYRYVAAHPLTGHAGRYAKHGYMFGRRKSVEGYAWARPRAIRAGQEGHRITKDIVLPKTREGLLWVDTQLARGEKVVREFIIQQYNTHLDPTLGPHVRKVQAFIEPYTSALYTKIYLPYILPVLEAILPTPLLPEAPPKTFLAMIADILPSLEGGHVAERRGKMDDAYDKVVKEKARAAEGVASAISKISKATESIKSAATASPSPSAAEKKFDRVEMERVRESLAKRVEQRGQAGMKGLKAQLLAHQRAILSEGDKFPLLASNARDEVTRDVDYILAGLDKLYTQSTTLTRQQVDASSSKSEARLTKKVRDAKERGEKMKVKWSDQGKPFVREAMDSVRAVLDSEWEKLKQDMAWIDDISPKDWTKYNAIKKGVDAWDEAYAQLHRGETRDKTLGAKDANINLAVSELMTELDDKLAGFKERLSILKKTALERIGAREMLASESSSSSKSVTAAESRVSILPIEEEVRAAGTAGEVIGKGRQQVMDALSMAEAAASTASVNAADNIVQGTQNVESVISEASKVVNGASSPTGAAEHLESFADNVKQGYASVVSEVGEAAHTATRSAKKAAGVSVSPANLKERLEDASLAASSFGTQVASTAASMTSVAAESLSSIHSVLAAQATDLSSRINAAILDFAPTATHEPLVSSASAYLSSLSSARSADLESIIARGSDLLGSIQAEVSGSVHSATRAASRAVGATPTPETAGEYVEAAQEAVGSVASEASKSVEDAASVVVEQVKEGTESVKRAVGKDEL